MLCLKGRLLTACCALIAALPAVFAQASVRINEVLADNVSILGPDNTITDWVEIVNTSGTPVDLAGATLSDNELIPDKWAFPFNSVVPANGYLVVKFDADTAPSLDWEPNLNTGFNLSGGGDAVFLYGANFGPLLDEVRFGVQAGDLSIGKSGGLWRLGNPTPGAANTTVTLGSIANLKVNEWSANGSGDDWFEIYNPGTQPVSLEGLYFADRGNTSTVPALSFVGTVQEAFAVFFADGNPENGPDHVDFSLGSSGDDVKILDNLGKVINAVTFGPQAPGITEGRLPDGSDVRSTFPGTPSRGEPNFKELTSIYVSELLSHTDPPFEDAVEFYNNTDAPIDISGWYLSNKKGELKRYKIPPNTVVQPRNFKVFYENEFNFTNTLVPFNFNSAHGDQVYLAQADALGNLTGYRVGEDFEAAENPVSFGRVETSVAGVHQFVAMSARSFGVDDPATVDLFRTGQGATNPAPRVGPIVINEVHYQPFSDDGFDNLADEFIELFNISPSPVKLFDPDHATNTWRLQNGVSFSFPENQTIPGLGYALVVSFDPVLDPISLSNFRSKFNVPNTVKVYGPFRGELNNSGDSLEFNKPDAPQPAGRIDEGFVPYIRVDKVNYTDGSPWPSGPNGTGPSLQRKNSSTFGNDPSNWASGPPTPGAGNSAQVRDTDADGAPDVWEDQYSFDKTNPADGAIDTDGDRYTNVQEYVAGTNPRDAGSLLKILGLVPAKSEAEPLTLTFQSVSNRIYTVQYRNSLAINSDWQKLVTTNSTSGGPVTVIDTNTITRTDRYYQVIVSN